MSRYLLDANAFDHIVDRGLDPAAVRRLGEIAITDVQHGELLEVPDPGRREMLLRALSAIDPIVRPALVSWGSDDGDSKARREHDRVARESDGPLATGPRPARSPRGAKRWKDAAIGDVAAREGYTLVTNDKALLRRALEAGVAAMSCADAFAGLES